MAKEGSSDYKKVRKRWFFKEPMTEWFFVEPKMVLLWHRREEPFEAPLFLRVYFEAWGPQSCCTAVSCRTNCSMSFSRNNYTMQHDANLFSTAACGCQSNVVFLTFWKKSSPPLTRPSVAAAEKNGTFQKKRNIRNHLCWRINKISNSYQHILPHGLGWKNVCAI